jgi:hypothetical protein
MPTGQTSTQYPTFPGLGQPAPTPPVSTYNPPTSTPSPGTSTQYPVFPGLGQPATNPYPQSTYNPPQSTYNPPVFRPSNPNPQSVYTPPQEMSIQVPVQNLNQQFNAQLGGMKAPSQYWGTSSAEYGQVSQEGYMQNPQDIMNFSAHATIPKDEVYMRNKQLEVSEYNTRVQNLNKLPIAQRTVEMDRLTKMNQNIMSDLDTQSSIIKNRGTGLYTIPISGDKGMSMDILGFGNIMGKKLDFQPKDQLYGMTSENVSNLLPKENQAAGLLLGIKPLGRSQDAYQNSPEFQTFARDLSFNVPDQAQSIGAVDSAGNITKEEAFKQGLLTKQNTPITELVSLEVSTKNQVYTDRLKNMESNIEIAKSKGIYDSSTNSIMFQNEQDRQAYQDLADQYNEIAKNQEKYLSSGRVQEIVSGLKLTEEVLQDRTNIAQSQINKINRIEKEIKNYEDRGFAGTPLYSQKVEQYNLEVGKLNTFLDKGQALDVQNINSVTSIYGDLKSTTPSIAEKTTEIILENLKPIETNKYQTGADLKYTTTSNALTEPLVFPCKMAL